MGAFDPIKYKETTRAQWDAAAEAWHRWGPTLARWLGPATETMLDMARVAAGDSVLDVAAGAGEQTITAARRVGPRGRVLATDISANDPDVCTRGSAAGRARQRRNAVMDGENLDVPDGSFDVVMSRVGLIYFPDQHRALTGMRRALKRSGRVAAIAYSTADKNRFFSIPVSIIRERAQLPPPFPGQPGPFSLGAPGIVEHAFARAGFTDRLLVQAVPAPLLVLGRRVCAFRARVLRRSASDAERSA